MDDVRRRLELIAGDRAAAGVVVMLGDVEAGLGSLQSLRAALAACRASGTRVVAYLTHASTRLYYLASAADAVVMPESGGLDLVGLTLEATFLGDTLDRLGVAGEFERIAEYKSAIEPFTRDGMSESMREALNAVLDSASMISSARSPPRADSTPTRCAGWSTRRPCPPAPPRTPGSSMRCCSRTNCRRISRGGPDGRD